MESIVRTEGLSKKYGSKQNEFYAISNINMEVKQGEFVAIVGKSGSGKSTLLHLLGGLDRPTSGKVYLNGKDIYGMKEDDLAIYRRRKIGFIFQAFNLVSSINVWENMVLPLGLDGKQVDETYMKEIIETLGLESKIHSLPNTLSGGQQQRVAIGRALSTKPDVILADEPTGNLDTKTSDEVISLLKLSAKKYGQTIIMITHDEDIAQIADRRLVIEDGKVVRE
ncbi:ABC transporter ATP-binding protein [Anaerosporobacter faecicola]|uniref:ABC transporter ATP-binding protein n=1 Tax=Anaerosporobacter faecicola TaxID=2718714 RepID=UPI00143CBB10|nr:ABC transporter ATP-binding protein [Anaerosporobacter faecicola]